MAAEPQILVLCADLLFGSQIHGAIQRAGRIGRTCLSQKTCLQLAPTLPPGGWIVVNVEQPELDLAALRVAAPQAKLLAFGPHVHADLLRAAQDAGCDYVWTRGQMASQFEQLLTQSPAS